MSKHSLHLLLVLDIDETNNAAIICKQALEVGVGAAEAAVLFPLPQAVTAAEAEAPPYLRVAATAAAAAEAAEAATSVTG
jgi:hypothetical protein